MAICSTDRTSNISTLQGSFQSHQITLVFNSYLDGSQEASKLMTLTQADFNKTSWKKINMNMMSTVQKQKKTKQDSTQTNKQKKKIK